jgi:nicotinamide-nucleotide amidase
MQIEVIAIGDEILRGTTVNSNAALICTELFRQGFLVSRQTVLPDAEELLEAGLKEALARSDLVIGTGGLGPTCDDHTRSAAARLFSAEMVFNEALAEDLRTRFGKDLESATDQATVPKGAHLLSNRIGTASGLVLSKESKRLVLLPGIPSEMQAILTEELIPYLLKTMPGVVQVTCVQVHLCHLFESLVDPTLRALSQSYPSVQVGIYPTLGFLTVVLQGTDSSSVHQFEAELKARFSSYVFSSPKGKIEEALHGWFVREKKTLALAESCTGGQIAAQLVSIPGASDYFLGSLVTYSNSMKCEILGVSEHAIKKSGAVSRETALEMLSGVFQRTGADYALAITGIAGPSGGSAEKPIGTMWAALGARGESPEVGTFLVKGNRQMQMLAASNHLLCALWRKIIYGIPVFPFF